MHRALSSFEVLSGDRRLGFVQERSEGGWRAFKANGHMLGDYARPAEARAAVVQAALRNVGGEA